MLLSYVLSISIIYLTKVILLKKLLPTLLGDSERDQELEVEPSISRCVNTEGAGTTALADGSAYRFYMIA